MSKAAIKTRNILYEKGIYLEDGAISTVMINALSGTLTTRFIDDLEETVQNFNTINSIADFWWNLYDHDRYLELAISIETTYKLMGTPVPNIINAILYSNDIAPVWHCDHRGARGRHHRRQVLAHDEAAVSGVPAAGHTRRA